MGYFAGLDVSLEETTICVVDEAGRILREARAVSEPEALVEFFRASGMQMERIGLEACSLSAWLHAGLMQGSPHRLLKTVGVDGPTASSARIGVVDHQDRSRP